MAQLAAGSHAQDAPVLLRSKSTGAVLLPHIVERAVEDDVVGQALLDAGNGRFLVCLARDRQLVRLTLRRPPGLRDHGGFATGSFGNLLHPVRHKLSRFLGRRVTVEESVAVDRAIIRGGAKFRVGFHGHHGVDRDDRAVVAGGFENGFGLADSTGDLTNGSATVIDQFVADADGIDNAPISFHSADNSLTFALYLVDIEDAQK